jgi:hypothetical protein
MSQLSSKLPKNVNFMFSMGYSESYTGFNKHLEVIKKGHAIEARP